jgi:vacuolar-type H+-ATPase subunit E/Vma4
MSVEALLSEVEEKRKKTVAMLEAEYSAKKDEVSRKANEQKAYIADSSKREADSLTQRERIRIGGAAKLQSKKMMFDATEKMLENNVAALKEVLADYADSKEYNEMLAKMVKYAKRRLGGNITVWGREKDSAALKKHDVKVGSTYLETMGGFKATNASGTLELDLTFEELLRSREEEARAFMLGKE